MLSQEERSKWLQVRSDIEMSTDSWLTMTLKCLTIIAQRPNCVNILVTNNQLVAALACRRPRALFGIGVDLFDTVTDVFGEAEMDECGEFACCTIIDVVAFISDGLSANPVDA